MKNLFLFLALVCSAHSAFALELLSHKSTSTGITKLADSAVNQVWASSTPSCLKDGSKLLGVNKAFRTKGLKYSDCSTSNNALEKQRMLGYQVAVIRFVELSDSMAKSIKK